MAEKLSNSCVADSYVNQRISSLYYLLEQAHKALPKPPPATEALLFASKFQLGGYMNYNYQSENITELAKALLNVQRAIQPIAKDAENLFTKSWNASLNSGMDACRDALIKNGI